MDKLFRYRAATAQGEVRGGQLREADSAAAARQLVAQGLTPVQIDEVEGGPATARSRRQPSRQALQALLEELATLLGAGVSLGEALPSLARAYAQHELGPALEAANRRVRAGSRLSEAIEQPGLRWPAYALALIRAGEASGDLAPALRGAAAQLAEELRAAQELRSALIYPSVLVVAGIGAVLVVFVGVVPRFAAVLKSSRGGVPEFSRVVIESGIFLQANLHWIGLGTAALLASALAVLATSAGREAALAWLARLPVIGTWIRSADLGRWAHTIGMLLQGRVAFLDALALSAGVLRLRSMREALLAHAPQIKQGRPLSEVLETLAWFPDIRINLVRVGERSGELPRMLMALGQAETERARTLQRRVLVLVEPVAILLIGGVIGFIMVAVMMAITSFQSVV